MDTLAFDLINDPLHRVFFLLTSRRAGLAAKAESARWRGDEVAARKYSGAVAKLDDAFARVKGLLEQNPKRTRESFTEFLDLAERNRAEGDFAAEAAFWMLVHLARTYEETRRNADLAGWIESSRVAPAVHTPEEELRLWNERALTVEEEGELWSQGLGAMEIAMRVFPHRMALIKGGGRALSPLAQVEYAERMAKLSNPAYERQASGRLLRRDTDGDSGDSLSASEAPPLSAPDGGFSNVIEPISGATESPAGSQPTPNPGPQGESFGGGQSTENGQGPDPVQRTIRGCGRPKCRHCRLRIIDPVMTVERLREVLKLCGEGYTSENLAARWGVAASTVRGWHAAARHRHVLGLL